MNLKQLVQSIASVTGQADNEEIKSLLANEALETIELSDSVKDNLLGNLYTKEAAKNDKEIRDYFYEKIQSGIYGNVDDVIQEHFEMFGITEDQRKEIQGYDSAMKRLKGLLKSAKETRKEKGDNGEVEKLHNQIKELKASFEAEKNDILNKQKADKVNFLIKNKVFEQKLIDNIAGGKEFLAEATIKRLSEQYHLEENNGQIEIKQKDDPQSDVYINNEKATFDIILSKELDPFIKRNDDKPVEQQKRTFETKEKKFSEMTIQEQIKHNAKVNGKTTSLSYK